MVDKVTLQRIELLHPKIRQEVKDLYINKIAPTLGDKVICRFTQTYRSFEEQDALYAQGRTVLHDKKGNRLGKVTNAKGGASYHNYGLAIDIVLLNNNKVWWNTVKDFNGDGKADWMQVVEIFKAVGWTWGGDFKSIKDDPHFQKEFGLSIADLKEKHSMHRVDKDGYVIIS